MFSTTAVQGLEQASAQLDAAANNIARVGAASHNGATLDVVTLSQEMIALMASKTAFAVNLDVLKTADQAQRRILNVLA